MTRVVLKLGGGVAADSLEVVRQRHAAGDEVVVVHGAGPQITAELQARGIAIRFVRGRRFTDAATLAVVRSSLVAVGAELSAALGPAAVHLVGDEIGLEALPLAELGLVGEPIAGSHGGGRRLPRHGACPRRHADRSRTAQRQRRRGRNRDRVERRRRRGRVRVGRPGSLPRGAVVPLIHADRASELIECGTFDGGIVPKLMAAVRAARSGLTAEIGETAVVA